MEERNFGSNLKTFVIRHQCGMFQGLIIIPLVILFVIFLSVAVTGRPENVKIDNSAASSQAGSPTINSNNNSDKNTRPTEETIDDNKNKIEDNVIIDKGIKLI